MRSEWRKTRLDEIVILNPKESLPKNVVAKKIPMEKLQPFTKKIPEYIYEEYNGGVKFRNGDTLVARITPSLENGKTSFVDILDENEVGFGSTEFIVLRKIDGISDENFIYYLATGDEFRNIAIQSMTGSSGRQRVQTDVLASHKFLLPPLETQKKIAHILSTLDEKIELNRKMNETQEAMAQAIFKSWFVDFDPVHAKAGCRNEADLEAAAKALGISREVLELFPSEFVESEIGMIPKGWEVKPFSYIATLDTTSEKPFNFPNTLWKHYSIPAYDNNGYPVFEVGSEIKSNKYKVNKNGVLSSKLNPHTPRTWLPNVKGEDAAICSTEFMQFVPKSGISRNYIYLLITSKYFQDAIKSRVTGSTGSRQRAQPKEVMQIPVLHPSENIIEVFTNTITPLLNTQLENIEEIQILQQTRDTLLPKLLSGELDVSEVEI